MPSDISGCEHILCLNNGTCTDRSNGFNCSCSPGFSGNRCEISYLRLAVILIVRFEICALTVGFKSCMFIYCCFSEEEIYLHL